MSTTTTEVAAQTISEPQSPKATYQSPGRTPERRSPEARNSICSTVSRGSSLPTFVYPQVSPERTRRGSRSSSSFHSKATSEETFHQKMSTMLAHRPSKFGLIAYLAITVPTLALLSFLYTLLTILPLAVACACNASRLRDAIFAGHCKLFHVHARTMDVEHPDDFQNTLLLSLCTLPISILVSMSGLFALASQLYSKLLSEDDSDSSSLDRAMSFWFSWLDLFCKDMSPNKTDDLV